MRQPQHRNHITRVLPHPAVPLLLCTAQRRAQGRSGGRRGRLGCLSRCRVGRAIDKEEGGAGGVLAAELLDHTLPGWREDRVATSAVATMALSATLREETAAEQSHAAKRQGHAAAARPQSARVCVHAGGAADLSAATKQATSPPPALQHLSARADEAWSRWVETRCARQTSGRIGMSSELVSTRGGGPSPRPRTAPLTRMAMPTEQG